ncbi:MAG: O-antigen ligase family protein [Acidobacteriota bacterium]
MSAGTPPPPWVQQLRPVERRRVLAAAALVVLARCAAHGFTARLWAEEASLYFAYARLHGWLRSLLLVPAPAEPAGYLNLAANLPATLAAHWLPLEAAPWLTMAWAFTLQLLPVVLVLWGHSGLWCHRGQRLAAAALLVIAPSLSSEVWLNTINSQVFLGVAALLLLVEDFAPDDRRRLALAVAVIALGALSGPYTAFLAPFFLARGLLERRPGQRLLGLIAGAGALVQGAVYLWTQATTRSLAEFGGERFVERPLGWRLANVVHHQLLRPLLGAPGARGVSDTVGLDAAVDSASGLDLAPAYLALAGWSSLALLAAAAAVLLVGARQHAVWLGVAWLTMAPAIAFVIGAQRPSSRYMAVPGIALLLLVVARAAGEHVGTNDLATQGESRRRRLARVLVAIALVAGLGDFFREEPPGALGLEPGRPSWADEVAAWRADPEHLLAVWPYAPPQPWRVFLADESTPPVRPLRLERPLRLVSTTAPTRAGVPVDGLAGDFRLDLRLVASCAPSDCFLRLRLEDEAGEVLRLLAPTTWTPGRPFRWSLDRLDPRLDGVDLARVAQLGLVVRSLDERPVRWIVQELELGRRVRGVLEPLLPAGPQAGPAARRVGPATDAAAPLWALAVLALLATTAAALLGRAAPIRRPGLAGRLPTPETLLLLALGAAPILAFWPRVVDGALRFVLYREAKLVAGGLCAWLVIAVLLRRLPGAHLRASLERMPILVLGAWLGWSATTRWWGWTPENWLYEMVQHLTVFALAVVLPAAATADPRRLERPLVGLAAGVAAASALGGLQLLVDLPWLTPIDAWVGVGHPSTMGYKNPMALAVVAQLFLLVGWAARASTLRARLALGLLVALELLFLVSLQSRTALLAVAVGMLFAGVAGLARLPRLDADARRRLLRRGAAGLAAGVVVVALGLLASPAARERAAVAFDLVRAPATYLETDRGVYLRNTLAMVADRPLGVGLGDWQTAYPVYRRVAPTLAYDDIYRVRRAHSDLVQTLGETGWPGLVLWAAVLAVGIGMPLRRWWRADAPRPFDLALAAQGAALAAAMATDYVVEMPALELVFALVWIAAIGTVGQGADTTGPEAAKATRRGGLGATVRAAVLGALVTLAVLLGLAHLALLPPRLAAADARWLFDASTIELDDGHAVDSAAARRILALGARLERWPGLSKSLHRDVHLLATVAHLTGEEQTAKRWALRALRLHRHDPDILRLLAAITGDPGGRYERAAEHILHETSSGFLLAHPLGRDE